MVPPQGRSAKRAIELNLHILAQAFENLRLQALVKVDLHVMLERRVIAEGRTTNEQVGIFLNLDHLIDVRSEDHTSELQSLTRISYAVFCEKKKNHNKYP